MLCEALPPLSLYVHLPWCIRKCPYCDFNSYEARGALPTDSYVDALLRDLDCDLSLAAGRRVQSVFIGGGTPSLIPGASVRGLLAGIRERLLLAAQAEITLEANPGAVEAGRFAEFRDAGVTRLSIGAQSFRSPQLRALGRVHTAEDAIRAVETARRAGFENINVDLMYALPGDDVAGALDDLRGAIELAPAHISWYQLTLEPNTAFHRRPPVLPDEDAVLEIEGRGRALLDAHGYRRYEISAYAQPGRECLHNLNYWQFGDYLGIGAGAHGKITQARERGIERRVKQRNPRTYVERAGDPFATAVERVEPGRQIIIEFLMNALRLPRGVSTESYEARTGHSLAAIEEPLRSAVARGWMEPRTDRLVPTAMGLELQNSLLALF